ncbi:MAG: DsbA family oxidoreductase [Rhodospirillaceae bacterium]|jgi:predicted DsbA family dithiol-disulfide isomerase|nr:DsbA family oxidoreductase [Rhodospirillaceae bacterium]MBT5564191.1 DsbA family oxidoreductase [Rhodospirillaceae bacterium]MBT6089296.1 DsbA family oxidoreductase [Rhodospirillaceae bacterium]MBT7451387.1 DsbA family oxidoreductase [Rhodospirillaceae bacterium]
MKIEIVFDTVCPWCYVGKRRFDRALKDRPNLKPEIQYRSFLLNPDLPPGGVDRREFLERKFGSPQQYERVIEALVFTGKGEGIDFALDKIDRTPNSANSHRLVRLAQAIGAQGKAVDALFAAYFERGMDIGDPEILIRLAEEIGLDRQVATTHMLGEGDLNSVFNENARMHRLGVTGVPCYIFNESKAISGAQEPEIIVRMLDMASAQEAEQPTLQSTG